MSEQALAVFPSTEPGRFFVHSIDVENMRFGEVFCGHGVVIQDGQELVIRRRSEDGMIGVYIRKVADE